MNERYDLKIGILGNKKFYSLFDEKLKYPVYQIKSNGIGLEEYYPTHNNSIEKNKIVTNRVVPEKYKNQILKLAQKDIESKKIFLVGCSAKKNIGFHKAKDLYNSSRITFAKNTAESTNSDLYILSAKFGVVSDEDILPHYDLKMDKEISEERFLTVSKQLRLNNVTEIVFFRAGINKHYFDLMVKVTNALNIKLITIGNGESMRGAKEVEKALLAS